MSVTRAVWIRAALVLAVEFVAAASALAGPDLNIVPLKVSLSAKSRAAQLEVGNSGDEPDLLQSRVTAWSRHRCVDDNQPSESVVVSPPIFTLPPNSTQVVRVLLAAAPEGERESTWRVMLTEIGPPSNQSGSVTARLAISLPVFVLPLGPAAPKVEWSLVREGAKLAVSARNAGTAHTRLRSLKLAGPNGASLLDEAHTDYLLAGDSCRWMLPGDHLPAGTRLIAITEEGEATLPVPDS